MSDQLEIVAGIGEIDLRKIEGPAIDDYHLLGGVIGFVHAKEECSKQAIQVSLFFVEPAGIDDEFLKQHRFYEIVIED